MSSSSSNTRKKAKTIAGQIVQVGQVVVGTVVQCQTPTAAPACGTCPARAGFNRSARHKWLALCRRQRWLRPRLGSGGLVLNRFPCHCA